MRDHSCLCWWLLFLLLARAAFSVDSPTQLLKMPKAKRNVKNTRKSPMVAKPSEDPLFPARERNPRIGGAIRPTTDLSRFVKWPRNVKLQRRKKLLTTRLKIPPAINQFTRTLSKDQAKEMFMLLTKYKPEDKHAKKERLRAAAQVCNIYEPFLFFSSLGS